MELKLVRVVVLKRFDEVWGVHIFFIDPLIVCWGVSLPSYEVLSLFPSSVEACVSYLLHFPFFFSVDDIRRRFKEVGTVLGCFFVRGE